MFRKALCILAISMTTSVYAVKFSDISQVYFFGDSLTDSGFNDLWPGRSAGKAPTFTTYGGHTWSQIVARDIKGFAFPDYSTTPVDTLTNNSSIPANGFVSATLTGVNYAAAGSTTNGTGNPPITYAPSLRTQVSFYLSSVGGVADPNAVYFVWSGANDFLEVLAAPPFPSELELLTIAQTAAANVAYDVNRLALAGAKRIVVMSLPNLGLTPMAIEASGADPTLPGKIKNLSFQFNSMLNTQLGVVLSQNRNLKILFIDTYTMLGNVVSKTLAGQPYVIDNQSFYFTNATVPACGGTLAIECTQDPSTDSYVFADNVHPTGMTHQALSLEVEQALQNPNF